MIDQPHNHADTDSQPPQQIDNSHPTRPTHELAVRSFLLIVIHQLDSTITHAFFLLLASLPDEDLTKKLLKKLGNVSEMRELIEKLKEIQTPPINSEKLAELHYP